MLNKEEMKILRTVKLAPLFVVAFSVLPYLLWFRIILYNLKMRSKKLKKSQFYKRKSLWFY